MQKQTKKQAIKEAVEKCPYKKECEKTDISDMNSIEIGKYLNVGNHNHPIILKHGEGYDLHYSIEVGGFGVRSYHFEQFKSFKDAIKRYGVVCGEEK